MKSLEEIIKGRRSIRSFLDREVPMEVLKKLVELGSWAPSGSNAQAWEFIILNQKSEMKKFMRFSPGLFQMPGAMIFLCTDLERSEKKGGRLGRDVMSLMDVAMAAQNIMLEAYSLGLGSCPLKGYDPKAAQILLKLPDSIRPDLLIILGYPDMEAKAPSRRPISEIMHKGGWDSEHRPGETSERSV